jgi:hypothetical protein
MQRHIEFQTLNHYTLQYGQITAHKQIQKFEYSFSINLTVCHQHITGLLNKITELLIYVNLQSLLPLPSTPPQENNTLRK